MRICFVVSDFSYPPREGLHQQTQLQIEALRDQGFTVDVFGYVRNGRDIRSATDLNRWFQGEPIFSRFPALVLWFRNLLWPERLLPAAERYLIRTLIGESYDVIHLEGVAAAGLARKAASALTVIGLIDPQSRRRWRMAGQGSAASRAGNLALALVSYVLESIVAKRAAAIHVVSTEDEKYLRKRELGCRILWVPVLLPPELEDAPPLPPRLVRVDPLRVVLFADLRHAHMRRAFNELLDVTVPLVRSASGQEIAIDALCRVIPDQVTSDKAAKVGVSLTPWVDDYRSHLSSADVIVIPDLTGTGLKNRAIQALALERTVVGTAVAFEGIPISDGINAIVYNGGAELADVLLSLCHEDERRASIGRSGRLFALQHFSRASGLARWTEIYKSISSGRF